ncbi:MAG: hypothetical protein KDC83_04440 [Flavobacteriales bacterium]|nr:hypothetical protein [Flavobacteriales bacterium]
MTSILSLFIIIPLVGFVISVIIPKQNESLISKVAFYTSGIQLLLALSFTVFWCFAGMPNVNIKKFTLYKSDHYEFFIDFFCDNISIVFLLMGALLTFLIANYSRFYLHREEGFKRFYNTILFFYLGYNITIFSGNFETLFMGWEVLGISSFLLIAYYRDRYLPVKNAFKVFSVYRIGDMAMILAMWMSHHIWHHNITFSELANAEVVYETVHQHSFEALFVAITIFIAATVKSAQFPFSSWLPRAMEGPTPSSAIFYSSLSVHIGVFVLLRTYPLWESQILVRVFIIAMGLLTAFMASRASKVQSSIKSQIAYSSVAQIGIIFIEIALGLEWLALLHFAGNAFLRTYQLLVSPSVVTFLIREQFFNPKISKTDVKRSKWANSLYVLSLKEWNLDSYLFHYLWKPFKTTGKKLNIIPNKLLLGILLALFALGCFAYSNSALFSHETQVLLPYIFSFIGLILVLKSFVERIHIRRSWLLIASNHAWIAMAISLNERFGFEHVALYLSGISIATVLGILVINNLIKKEPSVDLNSFYGHVYEYPGLAFLFLLACLSMSGFPITFTFLGVDLIFSHIHQDQLVLVCILSVSFILSGLSIIRIYARLFMGPHVKSYHSVSHRSA